MNSFSSRKIGADDDTGSSDEPFFTQQKLHQKKDKQLHASMTRRLLRWIPKNKQDYEKKKVPFFILLITLLIAFGIIFKVTYTSYQYIVNFSVSDLLSMISTDLEHDEDHRTNILLLGAGGGDHDGADLTDTIIVASLDQKENSLSLVSLPRDLWIELPEYQSSRINKIYDNLKGTYGSEQALDILLNRIENITDLDIPYYVKVDFKAFTEIIDTMGGVEVMVQKSIYDTAYPTPDGGYETFEIDAGLQTLDGETALKFARSRHSTSDFDRAQRQQQLITAIKEKASETDFLSSPLLLKNLYEDFSDNVETNMSITELVSLGSFAKELDRNKISNAVIKDNEVIDIGSFLYTPERELYGGAFVLIPLGNTYQPLQTFIQYLFDFPGYIDEGASIQILNGAGIPGFAASVGQEMIPFGFNVQRYDNADKNDHEQTHYYINHPQRTRLTEQVLNVFLPNAIKMKGDAPKSVNTDYDISIILGSDIDTEEL